MSIMFESNSQYKKYSPIYQKDEDAYEGQEQVKNKSTAYLPMLAGQKADDRYGQYLYDLMLQSALWYPATGATVRGYLGVMYRKEPITEIPDAMQYVQETFSDDGKTIHAFAKNLAKEVIVRYRPAVLVDFPSVEGEELTVAQAESLKLRPYAVLYNSMQIIDWHERIGRGVKKLDYVVLAEKHEVRGFKYKNVPEKAVVIDGFYEIRRVLKLEVQDGQDVYTQEVYIRVENKGKKDKPDYILIEKTYPMSNGQTFDYIPIVPCSEEGLQWNLNYSLINDLVNLNIADYNNEALYRDNLKFLARPTICVKGLVPPEGEKKARVTTGSSSVWEFDETGEAWLLGGDSSQASALVDSGKGLKQQMATIGLRGLASEPNGVESAETATIHRSGEHGILSSVANAVSDTMTKVLQIMAEWANIGGEVSYTVQTDFIPTKIDATLLNTLWNMYVNGDLPLSQFLINLKNGEVLESTVTEDEFKEAKAEFDANKPKPVSEVIEVIEDDE